MSASLVGSEMCIRDSNCSQPLSKPVARTSSRDPRLVRKPTHAKMGITPVSYTHLTLPTICSV
eukprot:5715845-Alexandrium_andersonii.AAC.1